MLITATLLKVKARQEAQLRQDAEADAAEAQYRALPVLCEKCGDRAPDLHYTRWQKDADGYRALACRCGAQTFVE